MLQGDCMDFMRDKPDKFWDLAIVDPPYGIGEDGGKISRHWTQKKYIKKNWDNAPPIWNFLWNYKELVKIKLSLGQTILYKISPMLIVLVGSFGIKIEVLPDFQMVKSHGRHLKQDLENIILHGMDLEKESHATEYIQLKNQYLFMNGS